ncbi:hypothetical protein PAECIP111891_04239 [Paenibacillus allorhizoplanae]|uniref:Uncharacterized protein n=1 Tax=Paenibacillus allorhizoplanae TaxID=2905648 RepID=A0ABM9CKR9_9BACL|nr:hypothetical protein [Paenibacillus allorhizoplanae]CAH1215254.1 hypothetical protein PAECIP111891_04239 [Paenibacillus allorhizoplanae]
MQNMMVSDAIHLNQLHNILNSGLLHEADADMIAGQLQEANEAFGLSGVTTYAD